MNQNQAKPAFESPGPGVWQLDVSHFTRPLTRYIQEFFCEYYERGQALVMQRYGMPLSTIGARTVDGFFYVQPIPLGGPPGGKPPPAFVLKLLAYLLPTFRRCRKTAEAALKSRTWREDARRWDEEVWPELRDRFEALQRVALQQLDDSALLHHLDRATRAHQDSLVAHYDTNGATMLPTGMLLLALEEHSDIDAVDILATIGSQAPTVEEDTRQLNALRGLLAEQAHESLEGEPATVIEALRQREDDIGVAARRWLARVECRQIWAGDLYLPTAGELPQLLVEQLRRPPEPEPTDRRDEAAARLRARLPQSQRAEFDALLQEARLTAHLRDERCAVNDAWACGLVRLALLEVGHRLHGRELLRQAVHAIHLRRGEIETLLTDGTGPGAEDAARWAVAQARTTDDAPSFLGGEPPPPPRLDAIPGALGRMAASVFKYVDHMEGDLGVYDDDDTLRGTPASQGEYVGVARVVQGPEDFHKVKTGDVLVARATMPSYNGALAVAGAVVTDRGGALSHAAIVSRELGIPAVVGTINATKMILDGARVRVDGLGGTVEVLA